MTLDDLLVSYKQVRVPKAKPIEMEEPSRFDLFRQSREQEQQQEQTQDFQFPGWLETIAPTITSKQDRRTTSSRTGSRTDFDNAFDEYLETHNNDAYTRDILTSIANMESAFDQDAPNESGSSALGWFQFIDGTRSKYDKSNRQDFASNPQKQITAAVAHYKDLEKSLKPLQAAIDRKNLTPLQAMYGMWWRPESFKNYVLKGQDNFVGKDGMTIEKILEKAKNEESKG